MLALEDSDPHKRYWIVTNRLSQAGNRRLIECVRDSSQGIRALLDLQPTNDFLDSNPEQWIALSTSYAFADVPMGFEVAYALSDKPGGSPQRCAMRLQHIIWEYGIPLSATCHGHKHVLCWSIPSELPPFLRALPEGDNAAIVHGADRVYLVSERDLAQVQHYLSAV